MEEEPGAAAGMRGSEGEPDALGRWTLPRPAVPLGLLAGIRIVPGPPMIKDENGALVGYVFADIDATERDLGGWVKDAKRLVAARFALPAGVRLEWTGQYELLADMEARMRWVLPLTLLLIVVLLYFSVRGVAQTGLVLLSLPFALAGSVWLLFALDYDLSTAVWVGIIATGGVAAQTAVILIVYLDGAFLRAEREGALRDRADVDAVVVDTAASRARPLVMAAATTILGLAPLLFESGVGADVSARTAAPVVGGLVSCLLLTLLVLPAAYATWRRGKFPETALGIGLESRRRGSPEEAP